MKLVIGKKIIQRSLIASLMVGSLLLSGCATQEVLNSPCPNFGSDCVKKPVNTWQPPQIQSTSMYQQSAQSGE